MINLKTNNYNVSQEKRLQFVNKEIKHVMQMTKNDCGVACIKMAWLYFSNNFNDFNLDEILDRLGVKNFSLWTIDIAHICAIKNLKHVMYTITWGVQDSYINEDFYSKEREFNSEKSRICQLFHNSSQLGINIVKETVSLSFIKSEISNKKCVCIVLVDANLLNGKNIESDEEINDMLCLDNNDLIQSCSMSSSKCCFNYSGKKNQSEEDDMNKLVESNLVNNSRNNYLGHFIVLIGYDDLKNLIFYRNPASNKKLSITSSLNLEIARKSYGTDQDILFIYK